MVETTLPSGPRRPESVHRSKSPRPSPRGWDQKAQISVPPLGCVRPCSGTRVGQPKSQPSQQEAPEETGAARGRRLLGRQARSGVGWTLSPTPSQDSSPGNRRWEGHVHGTPRWPITVPTASFMWGKDWRALTMRMGTVLPPATPSSPTHQLRAAGTGPPRRDGPSWRGSQGENGAMWQDNPDRDPSTLLSALLGLWSLQVS